MNTGENPRAVGHDPLDRFARALAQIVHEERPELSGGTVSVAELYQDIAPYRLMRDRAGFELHADYEHALLRFLAGEGGHAQLDPESAADELGIEAESSDPDLSLYRKFAACDVRLALGATLPPRPAPAPQSRAEAPSTIGEPALASIEETLRALRVEPAHETPSADAMATAAPHAAPSARSAGRCAFCASALPSGREVRYCPFCGGDQSARACGECGEPLEDGWRFCVACGAPAET